MVNPASGAQLTGRSLADATPTAHNGRRAGAIDRAIGQNIRRQRMNARMSQEELASRIGISCQQLQKYEAGANRIAAARLVDIADALQVMVPHSHISRPSVSRIS